MAKVFPSLADVKKLRAQTKAAKQSERDEIMRRRQQVFDLNLSPIGQANNLLGESIIPGQADNLPQVGRMREYSQGTSIDPNKVLENYMAPNTVPIENVEYPTVKLADLEGRGFLINESDRAIANRRLLGVGNKPLIEPLTLETGSNFMFHGDQVWSSGKSPISRQMNQAKRLKEETGQDPVFFPRLLGPQGVDFDKNVGATMVSWNAMNAPIETVIQQDKIIKLAIPNWKGAQDPDSMAAFNAMPEATRKAIQTGLDQLKNEGGLSLANARLAITNPEYRDVPNNYLPAVGSIDVSQGITQNTSKNYPYGYQGEGIGLLETPLTATDLMNPTGAQLYKVDGSPVQSIDFWLKRADLSGIITPKLLGQLKDAGLKVDSNAAANLLGGGTLAALTAGSVLYSDDADASLKKLAERGFKIDRNPTTPYPGNESADFYVYEGDGGPGSKFVGKASMSQNYDKSLSSDDTEIAPALQGQGIGGEMYDAIQEMTGLEVKPSGYLTEAGARFWVSRDPEQMQKLLDGGYFGGQNADRVEEALEMKRLADEDTGPASVKLRGFGEPKPIERSVFPAPQRFFDPNSKAYKPFTAPFGPTEGGRYLENVDGKFVDITGETVERANLSVGPDGKASFTVGGKVEKVPATGPGRKIKTNLFKKSAGWNWTEVPEGYDPNPDNNFSLISMYDGKQHYYALETEFPEGVDLARYPNEPSEPKLKPTKEKATITLGEKVGEIRTSSGKIHPVYGNAIIRFGAPIVAGAGALGGTEEAEAARFGPIAGFGNKPQQVAEKIVRQKPGPINSFLNELTKFGVKNEELDAMGIREHFAGRQDVTRQEVIDFINTNPYQIFEDNLVSPTTTFLDYFKIFEPEALRPMQDALARGDREAADKLFAGLRERHTMEMAINEQPRWASTDYDLVLPGERTNDLEIVLQYPSASAKAKFQQSKLAGQVAKYRERQQDMVYWLDLAKSIRASGFDIGDPSLTPNDVKRNIINDQRLSGIFNPEDLADLEDFELDDALDFAFRRVDALGDLPAIDFAIEMDPGLGPVADELNRLRGIVREDSKTAFVNPGHYPNHPNPLLHMRLNHRDVYVQSDDMAVLEGEGTHIDELQSDYHQYARDLGRRFDKAPMYLDAEGTSRLAQIEEELKVLDAEERALYKTLSDFRDNRFDATVEAEGKEAAVEIMRELEGQLSKVTAKANALYQDKVKLSEAPPDAPFKDNWYELGLKKALINAVNTDHDFLTMTTGRDQAIRSRQLRTFDKVMVQPNDDGTFRIAVSKEGTRLNEVNTAPGARIDTELARFLGRDNATEILTDPNTGEVMPFDQFTGFEGKLTGETGGEGMKQYYDKTYVNKLNKMLKRYGGKVERFFVPGKDNSLIPVHGVRLTDEIKEAIRADKDSGSFTAFMHPGAVATAGIGTAAMVAPGGEAEARTVRPEPPELLRRPDADTPPADVPPRAAVAPSPLEQVERFKPKYDLTEVVGGVVTDLVEESGKIVFGAIASIFDPGRDAENKSRLDRVLESEEIFKDGPTYEKFKDGVGEVFDELVVPVVRAGLTTPTAFNPGGAAGISLAQDPTFTEKMPKSSIADQAAAVAELYKHLPEFLREEVLSRVGYAGLAILGALGLRDLGASRKVAGSAMSPIEQSNALPGETVPQLEAPTGVFSNAR